MQLGPGAVLGYVVNIAKAQSNINFVSIVSLRWAKYCWIKDKSVAKYVFFAKKYFFAVNSINLIHELYSHSNRFSNYMDKCSGGQNYLTVDKHGKVSLRALRSLESLAEADWKSYNPPAHLNHGEYRFWMSRSTGKCLTVFGGKSKKRTVGVAECKFDGENLGQLFAFRFHYHNNFCCCNIHNNWLLKIRAFEQ